MRNGSSCLFSILLFLAGCANQVTPGGGERDTKPPVVEKEEPENYTRNFRAKEIRITFDEFIQVKELATQLVVSPPMPQAPEARTKKKTLVVELTDSLLPNTTYTLNFGNAIGDLNEGNAAVYSYVFSTGDFVDTLSVTGSVIHARERVPVKDVKVMLYKEDLDSLPYTSNPLYFGVSDSAGNFRVANISAGTYKVIALKETNNNYRIDSPDEEVGFLPERVTAGDSEIELVLFREAPDARLQRAYSPQPGKFIIAFQGPSTHEQMSFPGDTTGIELDRILWNSARDTATFWYRNLQRDSVSLRIATEWRTDTVTMRLQRREDKPGKLRKFGLYLSSSLPDGAGIHPDRPITITASHPVKEWNASFIVLLEDSAPVQPQVIPDSTGLQAAVAYPWKESSRYSLQLLPGAATDIFDLKNDSLHIAFRRSRAFDFGTIEVKLSSTAFPQTCIFQLVSDSKDMIRETLCRRDTMLYYDYLPPGTYRIRIVLDVNGNGKEDAGNYLEKRQPEPVLWYPDKITIRSNWDVDLTWNAAFSRP